MKLRFFQIGLWIWFTIALILGIFGVFYGDRVFRFALQSDPIRSDVFDFRLDTISIGMLLMITTLGALIGQYAQRYLEGEIKKKYFYKYLLLIISSGAILVLSNHLVLFFAMWLLSSFGLHKLLLFFPDRRQAVLAAWKKFAVSRFGDLLLFSAIILTYQTFGTFNFTELFQAASTMLEHSPEARRLSVIGALFVLGAMSKSAQFPFHFWLPETMETPAPVSAVMHAGIINAGGFLIIRLSPLLQHAEIAHLMLTLLGSFTAVYGALVMITQNDIKKKLAFSTISQMGVMMLACGLGAYSLAFFHILAHSFYKAHAFLSTGFLVEESKRVKFNHSKPSVLLLIFGALFGYMIIALGSIYREALYIGYFTYAAILMLGFIQNIDFGEQSFSKLGSRFFLILFSVLIFSLGICYFFESFLHEKLTLLTPLVWGEKGSTTLQLVACFCSYSFFVMGLGLSALLIESKNLFAQKLYLYFWNGGYFTQRTNFLFDHYRLKMGSN